jgi:hypothetical protein
MVTLDPSTTIGKLRRLIFDFKVDPDGSDAYFQDEDLQVYLDEKGQNIYGAAVLALNTMLVDPGLFLSWSHGMESVNKGSAMEALKSARDMYQEKWNAAPSSQSGIVGTNENTKYYGSNIPTQELRDTHFFHDR